MKANMVELNANELSLINGGSKEAQDNSDNWLWYVNVGGAIAGAIAGAVGVSLVRLPRRGKVVKEGKKVSGIVWRQVSLMTALPVTICVIGGVFLGSGLATVGAQLVKDMWND